MKKIAFFFAFSLYAIFSCNKEVEVSDALLNFTSSKSTILADGKSTLELSVVIPKNTSADRRSLIFKTSKGKFEASKSKEHTVEANFVNGELTAKTKLRSSTEHSPFIVSVEPSFDSPIKEFILFDTIKTEFSNATSIELETSSFGISSNFLSEVTLIGKLKNSEGNFVSKGIEVLVYDKLEDDSEAHGQFRQSSLVTKDSSTIKTIYSSNNFPIGTKIKIIAIVLDSLGKVTPITDSLLLTINS